MRKTFLSVAAFLLAGFMGLNAVAADAPTLPEKKQTKLGLYMSAKEALQAKEATPGKVLFVDVRTPEEYEFVGHPLVADANVPFWRVDYSAWDEKKGVYAFLPNTSFVPAMERLLTASKLGKEDTIILMCRSGDRSAMAVNELAGAGYTRVYSVYDGFEGDVAKGGDNDGKRVVNGWKNAGLPWTYTMDKTKAYLE